MKLSLDRFGARSSRIGQSRTLEDVKKLLEELESTLGKQVLLILEALDGQLGFGDGTSIDNISGAWVSATTHATPSTDFAVAHNLGVVPVGFLLVVPPASGVINKGSTSWTTQNLYLRCTASSQSIVVFVIPPPTTAL